MALDHGPAQIVELELEKVSVRLVDHNVKLDATEKALDQLAEEGVVQLFRPKDGSPPVIGVVGQLQLDVLQSRLRVEYGVPAGFDGTQWDQVRWVAAEDAAEITRFAEANRRDVGEDHDGALVAFFTSDWRRRRAEEEWPKLKFHAVREQHGVVQQAR